MGLISNEWLIWYSPGSTMLFCAFIASVYPGDRSEYVTAFAASGGFAIVMAFTIRHLAVWIVKKSR